ncbi:MAG: Maf family protein [Elusimicrobiota bacterium]|jgi:septum formation protein|nr:Maf family protein [Elusimicrobiota bacterium]
MKKRIILASASQRRISLLKNWGLDFEICPSNIDEFSKYKKPSYIVKDLAFKKGSDIASKNLNCLILSADTIVVLNKQIIGKPKNKIESEKIIRQLNGSIHKVYTGVYIIDNASKKHSLFYDKAYVKMKELPESELRKLFGKHLDKAGSYAIQDTDDNFVDKIYGDYYTVVGLPHIKLKKELKKYKIIIK